MQRDFTSCRVVITAVFLALSACSQPSSSAGPSLSLDAQGMDNHRAELQRQDEEWLQGCMAEEGFEYKPVDPETGGMVTVPADKYELPTEDFVALYGWGYSTITLRPKQWDRSDALTGDYYQELAPSERMAWDETFGDCYLRLEDAAQDRIAEFQIIRQAEAEVWDRFEADQRVLDEYGRWSECMSARGFDGLTTPHQVLDRVQEDTNELWNTAQPFPQPDSEEYREIVAYELSVAEASLECDYPPPLLNRHPVLSEVFAEISDDVLQSSYASS